MNYTTGIQQQPPQSAPWLQQMQGVQAPWQYNQNHNDVMAGLLQQQAVDLDIYAQKMQDTYAQQQQQAQMQAALAGMQMMSQDQQSQQSLANSRLQNVLGFQGQILGGLLK